MKYLYNKHKEKILYLIFGGLTTLLSLITYYLLTINLLNPSIAIELQLANIISWLIGFLFAFFTNRKYVFNSNSKHKIKEFIKFFLSRITTLLLDMIIMYIFVTLLGFNNLIIKIISQIIVIVSNYLFSKLIVFKKDVDIQK